MRLAPLTDDELEILLVKAARLGASQALEAHKQHSTIKDVMTKQEVARYLSVSVATVTRWMSDFGNPIPYHKIEENGHPRFCKSEIDQWLKKRDAGL